MRKIITFQAPSEYIDVNALPYKYAIEEHMPIKLSNGMYLHSYKVTEYGKDYAGGDFDEECEAYYNERF